MSFAERQVFDLKAKYPTAYEFSRAYTKELMIKACNSSTQLCFLGDKTSPTLATMESAYGKTPVHAWMMKIIRPVFGITNSDEDYETQLTTITEVCFERFYNKRAKVWMIFCAKCHNREYKISYGTIKTDAVLDAANTFLKELPKMEQTMMDEQGINGSDAWKPNYDTWQYLTLKGRLRCAWLSTKERYEKDGLKGIYESINSGKSDAGEDMYYASIQIVMRRGLARIVGKEMIFDEDKYNEQLITLKD